MSLNALLLSFPHIDPVAVQLGPIAIRWYALAYLSGIIGGIWLIKRLAARATPRFPAPIMSSEAVDDLMFYVTLGIVIGGRLGRIFFYDFSAYFIDGSRPLLDMVKIWQGGMAFHGGLIGVILATLYVSRKHKVPYLAMMDLVAAVTPLGLFFGRIANFINGELWGKPADVPWAMVFPHPAAGPIARHPSQLYEAGLEGLLLLSITLYLATRPWARDRVGLISGVFLLGYGLARMFCELFREPDGVHALFGGALTISQGQTLSIPMALAGIGVILYALKSTRRPA